MKTKITLILVTLIFSMGLLSQNKRNTYDKEWKEVAKFSIESLPKSAIEKTEAILTRAIEEKNIPQIMRSYIYLHELNSKIDTDNGFDYIGKLENLLKQAEVSTDKALIHSVLADLYSQSYTEDRWNINQRTDFEESITPEDMKEWTTSNYINKIYEHLEAAIEDKESLIKDTAKSYEDIIELGEDSRIYRPTLYDFVMNRTIETAKLLHGIGNREFDPIETSAKLEDLLLPAQEYIKLTITPTKKYIVFDYYQEYLSDLLNRGLTGTIILVELDKFNFIKSLSYSFSSSERLEVLYKLEKLYANNETTAEIIDCIVDNLSQSAYDYHDKWADDRENKQQELLNKKIYDWLKQGINKYSNYKRIGILKDKLANLESPFMRVEGKDLFYAEDKIELDLIYKNTQSIKGRKNLKLYIEEKGKNFLLRTIAVDFDSRTTYNADTTRLTIGNLPFGKYHLKSNFEEPEHSETKYEFSVSNLLTYYRNSAKNEYEIFVVDRRNGKPVEGASVVVNKGGDEERKIFPQLTTNEIGMVTFKDTVTVDGYWAVYTVSNGEDKGLKDQVIYRTYDYPKYNYSSGDKKAADAISVFTDRSIYRPGQTLYYKSILIDGDSKTIANRQCSVKLFNPNRELVAEKVLVTNEYGSIAGEFMLPAKGLLGNYWIEVNGDSRTNVRVEEYKRPTFEVKFEKIDKTFTFGDKISLKGNALAYSGVSLRDADINYRITRQPFSFWGWGYSHESHFQSGTVKTKADGTFEIEFTPQAGDGHNILGNNVYTFSIVADVTDLNGETRSTTYSVRVGNISMVLGIMLDDQIEKSEEFSLYILAENLAGTKIETSGKYEIYTLDKDGKTKGIKLDGRFNSGEQEELARKIKELPSGGYRIVVNARDDNSREVKAEKDFVIFSYDDERPPYETDLWLVKKTTKFKTGKSAEIIYGTSDRDIYVLYHIYNNEKTFERRFVRLDNTNEKFVIPYQEEFGEEVYVAFTTVKDRMLKTTNVSLTKEKETINTRLSIKLDTFRDKLRPGQAETWTLSVYETDDKPASAEVLASMYDASLDQIYRASGWNLNRPYIYRDYLKQISYDYSPAYRKQYSFNFEDDRIWGEDTYFDFDRFKYGISQLSIYLVKQEIRATNMALAKPAPRMAKGVSVTMNDVAGTDDVHAIDVAELSEQKVIVEEAAPAPPTAGTREKTAESQPEVRRNFNETAFFYPQLRTNEKGETMISFTVPESNTKWRFRVFAHDKESKVGDLEKEVVTQKELMVTPNMPRFLRHGDQTSISAKISNLSENTLKGNVHIEFFNPIDDKKVSIKVKESKQKFALDANASTSATWTFDVPMDIDMLGVRIVAEGGKFSDGEQHVLVVLPNRMLVTETMPFDVTEAGEQTFVLDKMADNKSKTLEGYKLTLEFTANPAWYAVQALPVISNSTNENAVNWFASYFVNRLGNSVIKQYPKVANVIEAWTKQGETTETLISKLAKNEELKTILLEETPWVLDAKSETEQMQRLSLLFDLNNSKYQADAAILKLKELQTQEGGWAWYKDMRPNRSVTQYLLYGFGRLQLVGMVEYTEDVKIMLMKGIKYVDKQIVEDFNRLKKHDKNWEKIKSISTSQLEYLYMRAMYRDVPILREAREAERFYTDVICNNWKNLSLYEKSLLAVLAKEIGNKELAAQVVKSIREHSVENKERGMYWPNNKNNVFLSMSAVSAHVFMMEALKENGATTEEMDMMKRWLVKQKQTQVWESTHATIDAIAALLQGGSDWFGDGEVIVSIGGKVVEPENKELATGYFKTSWSGSDIKRNMSKVTVNSTDSKPAYGSLYWQYYEDMDKVTKQGGVLNVSKELYKEVTAGDSGKQLVQITEESPLKVGDKVVVRLVVRADRDMEFVQLKDMRAACFEPMQTISGMGWQNSIPYYKSAKDASTNYYFDVLPKGTYVFEYPVYINRVGEYYNGITSIQCAYAPEFTSHTAGIKVTVTE